MVEPRHAGREPNPKASTLGRRSCRQAREVPEEHQGRGQERDRRGTQGTKVVDQSDGSPCVVSYQRRGWNGVAFAPRARRTWRTAAASRGSGATVSRCRCGARADARARRRGDGEARPAEAEARKAQAERAFKAHEASKKVLQTQEAVANAGKAQGSRRGRRGSVAQAVEAASAAVAAAAAAATDAAKAVVDTIARRPSRRATRARRRTRVRAHEAARGQHASQREEAQQLEQQRRAGEHWAEEVGRRGCHGWHLVAVWRQEGDAGGGGVPAPAPAPAPHQHGSASQLS